MSDIAILASVRSAVGRAGKGSLALRRPDELAGEVVRGLLATPIRYVGLLGPRQRADDLLRDLRADAAIGADEDPAALHSPAGLDLGADSPEQIALAVAAEIQAVFSGRSGGWLRDRKGPIHEPSQT